MKLSSQNKQAIKEAVERAIPAFRSGADAEQIQRDTIRREALKMPVFDQLQRVSRTAARAALDAYVDERLDRHRPAPAFEPEDFDE